MIKSIKISNLILFSILFKFIDIEIFIIHKNKSSHNTI
jgi:hypothetical protein